LIKDNEILIFKEKFFEDKGILNVISYYQENDSKFYSRRFNKDIGCYGVM